MKVTNSRNEMISNYGHGLASNLRLLTISNIIEKVRYITSIVLVSKNSSK